MTHRTLLEALRAQQLGGDHAVAVRLCRLLTASVKGAHKAHPWSHAEVQRARAMLRGIVSALDAAAAASPRPCELVRAAHEETSK